MDDEEKLLGMMTIVEEQQESIKQQAESTRTIHSDLQQQLTRQQNDLAETHRKVINEYSALFKNHLTALTESSVPTSARQQSAAGSALAQDHQRLFRGFQHGGCGASHQELPNS